MAANGQVQSGTPVSANPTPVKDPVSPMAVSQPKPNDGSPPVKAPLSPKDFIISVAANISAQPLPNYDPNVWGVLTAISNNARKRQQGMNMLLTADEHYIGRLVDDRHFKIDSTAVSAKHCKIYREKVIAEDSERSNTCCSSIFIKDTSTNGTYVNWERLWKNSQEVKIQHGDIISLSAAPQSEIAFAFVYREVFQASSATEGTAMKRKADEFVSENKRLKGIGIGAPEGPLSLDDFRSLQRSNRELRKQFEDQVLIIDTLQTENRTTVEHCENEVKKVKESVTNLYLDQLKELRDMLDLKEKELVDINRTTAEQKHSIEDLNERLSASVQSCTEANEIMKSQKTSIAELKAKLDDERDQRKEEREKAAADLKVAVQRVQSEAQEEQKRMMNLASKREREQQEVIIKLEESLKNSSSQVEGLVSKLEEIRLKLLNSDNKIRQLETQICEEQHISADARKKVEELEHEVKRSTRELEAEKAAREEAWAKVSALELEINAALKDLDYERRKLRGARERIMLRETQLRAFYSTTEEISGLFAKQQEQLKSMQRTLEDEEDYDNISIDIDLNAPIKTTNETTLARENQGRGFNGKLIKQADSDTSCQRVDISIDEASATEKHDCDARNEDGDTQEADFTSPDHFVKGGGFGSDIDGIGTAPVIEGDQICTEQVLETESLGVESDRNIDLIKCKTLAAAMMQVDDETRIDQNNGQTPSTTLKTLHHSQSDDPAQIQKCVEDTEDDQHGNQKSIEDTEPGGTIRTSDLLASEAIGSWACSTAPSVHGENESQKSGDNHEEQTATAPLDFSGLVAESQTVASSEGAAAAARRNRELRELSKMIGIVAPDMKEKFGADEDDSDQEEEKVGSGTDSDTEGCVDSDDNGDGVVEKHAPVSYAETEGSDETNECQKCDDVMDEDDESTDEDSVG